MPVNPQQRIEISHDILAREVYARIDADEKMRLKIDQFVRDRYDYYVDTKSLLGKRDLDYIDPYIGLVVLSSEQKDFIERSRKDVQSTARRRRQRNLIIGSVLLIAAIGFAYVAWRALEQSNLVDKANAALRLTSEKVRAEADRAERALETAREAQRRDSLGNIELGRALTAAEAAQRADSLKAIALGRALYQAEKETTRAQRQASLAEARRLAGLAIDLARQKQFSPAMQLALLAYRSVEPPRPASIYQAFTAITAGQEQGVLPIRTAAFYSQGGTVKSIDFSPDGQQLLIATNGQVNICDLTGKPIFHFPDESAQRFAAYSPDGHFAVTGAESFLTTLWDLDKRIAIPLRGHSGRVGHAEFSPDGQYIVTTAYVDDAAKIWDRKGNLVTTFGERGLKAAHFSPDGRYLVSIPNSGSTKLWSRAGDYLHTIRHGSNYPSDVQFSPNSRFIATSHLDTIELWTLDGALNSHLTGHTGSIRSLVFHPDGHRLLTSAADATAKLWNLRGETLLTLELTYNNQTLADAVFSPPGDRIATITDAQTTIWDTTGNRLAQLNTSTRTGFRYARFSPDGQLLVTLSGAGAYTEIWKLTKVPTLLIAPPKYRSIKSAQLAYADRYVAFDIDVGGEVLLYSLNGELQTRLPGDIGKTIKYLTVSPDGKRLFAVYGDRSAVIWNSEGRQLNSWLLPRKGILDVAFSPANRHVATITDDGFVNVYSIEGESVADLAHDYLVNVVRFSPDGQQIVTVTVEGTVTHWDLSGKRLQSFVTAERMNLTEVAFSPDFRYVAVVKYNRLQICRLRDGSCYTPPVDQVIYSVAFSPDSRSLTAAVSDGSLFHIDVQRQLARSVDTRASSLGSLSYSPNGRYLAATNRSEQQVQLWDRSGTLVANICAYSSSDVALLTFSADGRYLIVVDSQDGVGKYPLPETYANWIESLPLAPLTKTERQSYSLREE